jgi:hypothetical protein
VDSPTDLAENIVAQAPGKDVLFVAALETAEAPPRERLHPLAALSLVLGLAAAIGGFVTTELEPWLRGVIVLVAGIPAVLASNRALPEIGSVQQIGSAEVPKRGRTPAKIGGALAWMAITVFGLYSFLWVMAQILPSAKP